MAERFILHTIGSADHKRGDHEIVHWTITSITRSEDDKLFYISASNNDTRTHFTARVNDTERYKLRIGIQNTVESHRDLADLVFDVVIPDVKCGGKHFPFVPKTEPPSSTLFSLFYASDNEKLVHGHIRFEWHFRREKTLVSTHMFLALRVESAQLIQDAFTTSH